MADLYSIIPGTQVSSDEILEAELVATQILQAKYPDIDLREGTGIRDLVIRPAATLIAMTNKALQYYFTQNTISGVNDSTPDDILDKIMSNWFLVRKQGSKAIINARLYFARNKEITLTPDSYLSTDSVLKFYPASVITIPSGSMTFDTFANEYYYDVELVAEQVGSNYNISSGSLLYFSNFDPYFLHAEINYLVSAAIETETNTEFVTRAKTAISTRNLINQPSIISKMLENFNILDGVSPIGFGDPEMIRDQIWTYVPSLVPPTVMIHNGGMIDVYSRVPLTSSIVQLTTDSTGKTKLGGAVYEFSRSQIPGSAVDDTVPFYDTVAVSGITRVSTTATVTTGAAHGYSSGQSITILGATQADYNGTFTITVTDATHFTYTVANSPVTPATGTITANKPVEYTSYNSFTTQQTLTSLTSVTTTATATVNNHGLAKDRWVKIAGASPAGYNGWFKITSVTQNTFTYTCTNGLSSPATGTITVTATTPEKDYGFSDRAEQTIDFGLTHANKTASFEIKYFQDIDGLQVYLEDADNRVMCADLLARGYNLYMLTVGIVGYNGPAPDSTTCETVTKAYLKSLAPGEIFVMADLVAQLNAAGITTIRTPIDVTYRYFHRDLIPVQTGTITDYHYSNDRTAIYMLETLTTTDQNI